MNKNSKKIINLIVKLTLGLGSIIFLFYKVHQFSTGSEGNTMQLIVDWWEVKDRNIYLIVGGLLVLVVLMFVNWWLEAWKWKILIAKIQKVTWKLSFKSVFSGVAAGVFTPFRLGSYLGRVIHLPYKSRILGLVLNLLGNIAQFLVTFFVGAIGVCFIVYTSNEDYVKEYKTLLQISSLSVLTLSVVLIYAFLNIGKFVYLFDYSRFTKKWSKYFVLMQKMDTEFLGKRLLIISLSRYLVIMIQYVIVFELIQFPVPIFYIFIILSSLFIIYHFLPTLSLLELGATKAALFILIFDIVGLTGLANITIGLTIVTFVIWMINLFVPSIFGAIFLFQAKLLKEK